MATFAISTLITLFYALITSTIAYRVFEYFMQKVPYESVASYERRLAYTGHPLMSIPYEEYRNRWIYSVKYGMI